MGFLNALKAANGNSWGVCTSSDFDAPCYLGPKNIVNNRAKELMISGTGIKDYVFTKNDVARCDVKTSGGSWIWFHIEFKDGKHIEFIMSNVVDQSGKPTTNFLNFISFMGL